MGIRLIDHLLQGGHSGHHWEVIELYRELILIQPPLSPIREAPLPPLSTHALRARTQVSLRVLQDQVAGGHPAWGQGFWGGAINGRGGPLAQGRTTGTRGFPPYPSPTPVTGGMQDDDAEAIHYKRILRSVVAIMKVPEDIILHSERLADMFLVPAEIIQQDLDCFDSLEDLVSTLIARVSLRAISPGNLSMSYSNSDYDDEVNSKAVQSKRVILHSRIANALADVRPSDAVVSAAADKVFSNFCELIHFTWRTNLSSLSDACAAARRLFEFLCDTTHIVALPEWLFILAETTMSVADKYSRRFGQLMETRAAAQAVVTTFDAEVRGASVHPDSFSEAAYSTELTQALGIALHSTPHVTTTGKGASNKGDKTDVRYL